MAICANAGLVASERVMASTFPIHRRNARPSRANRRVQVPRSLDHLEDRNLLSLTAIPASPNFTAGVQPSSPVVIGSFVDTDTKDTASDFVAEITWGNGNLSFGSVALATASTTSSTFQVSGTNEYASPGSYTIQILVEAFSGAVLPITSTATVTAATPTPTPTSTLTINANNVTGTAEQALPANTTVATFIDTNTADTFSALISWGDGNSSPGTVQGSNGVYTVTGTNNYATAGTYTTTVNVVGIGTAPSATVMGVATVNNPSTTSAPFTGGLSSVGNGLGYPLGYTNTNQPIFVGTAAPFATVELFGRPKRIDTQIPLGEAVVNSSGQWNLTSGPLAPAHITSRLPSLLPAVIRAN